MVDLLGLIHRFGHPTGSEPEIHFKTRGEYVPIRSTFSSLKMKVLK